MQSIEPQAIRLKIMEARGGFEPPHKGFADLSLNHLGTAPFRELSSHNAASPAQNKKWSGRRDLNPRLRPWQGRTLPLSYSRG